MQPTRDTYPVGVPDEFFGTLSRLFSWRRLAVEIVCLSAIGIGLALAGVDPLVVAGVGALLALCLALLEVGVGRHRTRRWQAQLNRGSATAE